MRILIVGAGAVGQSFGYHLARGGVEVGFLVKPAYAEQLRAGLTLYDLRAGGRTVPLAFDGYGTFTTPAEVAAEKWDVVLITVSGDALVAGSAEGGWLGELVAATPGATIVAMQPVLGDADRVRALAGPERVVWGIIELIAYQAPLAGSPADAAIAAPGVAFYIPSWLVFPFSGPADRTAPIVAAFRSAGLRARAVPDTEVLTAVGAPWLNLHIAALESVGWRLATLRGDRELLSLTDRAVRQAIAVATAEHGVPVPLWVRLVRPWHTRLLSWVAERVLPLDLDPYLAFHFTKVGEQMRQSADRWIALAEARGLPHDAIDAIRARRDAASARARAAG